MAFKDNLLANLIDRAPSQEGNGNKSDKTERVGDRAVKYRVTRPKYYE